MDVEKMVGSELITFFFFFCCFYLCEFPLVALEGGLLPGKTLRSYNFSLCFEKRFLSTLARFEEASLARVNTRVKIRCSRSVPLLCTSGSGCGYQRGGRGTPTGVRLPRSLPQVPVAPGAGEVQGLPADNGAALFVRQGPVSRLRGGGLPPWKEEFVAFGA